MDFFSLCCVHKSTKEKSRSLVYIYTCMKPTESGDEMTGSEKFRPPSCKLNYKKKRREFI